MRFMMLLKADKRTEAGELPSRDDLEVMGKYNEELIKSGVLLDGAGLQPSSKGAKVTFAGGKPQVTDGPFAETKELIAGYCKALADGGKVTMPFEKTFWSPGFGMTVDRFGTPWMVNTAPEK